MSPEEPPHRLAKSRIAHDGMLPHDTRETEEGERVAVITRVRDVIRYLRARPHNERFSLSICHSNLPATRTNPIQRAAAQRSHVFVCFSPTPKSPMKAIKALLCPPLVITRCLPPTARCCRSMR